MEVAMPESKFHPPVMRKPQVHRKRLFEILDAGIHRMLSVVTAPAGFGKTTLLVEWLKHAGARAAWITLDHNDNDPIRFLQCLDHAFRMLHPGMDRSLDTALQEIQVPTFSHSQSAHQWLETLVVVLINAVGRVGENILLILDDVQNLDSFLCQSLLQSIVVNQPRNLRLVLSSREDPPFSIATLRARDQLTEICASDLRFTLEESGLFFQNTMRIDLKRGAVERLYQRTEGWIVGLQLAAISLRNLKPIETLEFINQFTGTHRHVSAFLLEEVMRRQPLSMQRFLLQSSLFDRFSASLCDFVLDDMDPAGCSSKMLERIEGSNLFLISLDDQRQWFRYHHLFGDFLRHCMQQKDNRRCSRLHLKASMWFEENEDYDQAFRHAVIINDHARMVYLAEQYGLWLLAKSRLATFFGWIEKIPPERILERALLCLWCGWAFAISEQVDTVEQYVTYGEKNLESYQPIFVTAENRGLDRQEILGHAHAIRAFCARLTDEQHAAILDHSERALALLPEEAHLARCVVSWNLAMLHMESGDMRQGYVSLDEAGRMAAKWGENTYVIFCVHGFQGAKLIAEGRLREAASLYDEIIKSIRDGSELPGLGLVYLGLAGVLYQRGEFESAWSNLDKALVLSQRAANFELEGSITMLQAYVAKACGDEQQAQSLLEKSDRLMHARPIRPHDVRCWAVWRAKYGLFQSDWKVAEKCIESFGFRWDRLGRSEVTSVSSWIYHAEYLVAARRVFLKWKDLADESRAKLMDFLGWMEEVCKENNYTTYLIETMILKARVWRKMKQAENALVCLQEALELAEKEGFVQIFCEEGKSIAGLLRRIKRNERGFEYAQKLFPRFNAKRAHVLDESLVERLSRREVQVLGLIAEGLKNKEIATRLYLSAHTVRTHTSNIYGKLNVKNRVQAIEKAKKLGYFSHTSPPALTISYREGNPRIGSWKQ